MCMISILIIDDDLIFVKNLFNELSNKLDKEFSIKTIATDGEEAIHNMDMYHYDVILLDLQMPNINGIQLIEKIKKIKSSPKIIVISGDPILIHKFQEIKTEVFSMFNKPLNSDILVDKLIEIKTHKEFDTNKVEELLLDFFQNFEFNKNSLGYKYLKDCIVFSVDSDKKGLIVEKEIYEHVALKNNISNSKKIKWNIEKSLKTMIRFTKKEVLRANIISKPTPKKFINCAHEYIVKQEYY